MLGAKRQVVGVLVALLGAQEFRPEPLPAGRDALPDLEGRGLARRPRTHVAHRLILVVVDAHRDEEVEGEVLAPPAAPLEALVDEVELPAAELGVRRPHHHRAVASLAGEAKHPRLGYREVDGHLPGGGREAHARAVELGFLAAEELAKLLDAAADRAEALRLAADGVHRDPARPEPEERPPSRDLVEGRRRVRGHRGMAGREVGHPGADLDALGRERGEGHRGMDVLHPELVVDEPQGVEAEVLHRPRELADPGERFARAHSPRDPESGHHRFIPGIASFPPSFHPFSRPGRSRAARRVTEYASGWSTVIRWPQSAISW